MSLGMVTANAQPLAPQRTRKQTAASKARKAQKAAMVRQLDRSLVTVQTKAVELGKLTQLIRTLRGRQEARAKLKQARTVVGQLRSPLGSIHGKVTKLEPGDMTNEQISAASFRLVEAKNSLRQASMEAVRGQPPTAAECTQRVTADGGCARQACLGCCTALSGAAKNACDFACEAEAAWCLAEQVMKDLNESRSSGIGAITHG
jgi:hypothetical protein